MEESKKKSWHFLGKEPKAVTMQLDGEPILRHIIGTGFRDRFLVVTDSGSNTIPEVMYMTRQKFYDMYEIDLPYSIIEVSWTEDMVMEFARIATSGSFGEYSGKRGLKQKLEHFKMLHEQKKNE